MSDEIGSRWSNEVLNDPDYRRRISRLDTQSFDPLPLSVHAGDEEGAHPDTCWCSVCAERERRREIEESFLPWHQNVSEVARLLRWLLLHDCAPRPEHIPDLIANAQTWQADYDHMKMWERRRP